MPTIMREASSSGTSSQSDSGKETIPASSSNKQRQRRVMSGKAVNQPDQSAYSVDGLSKLEEFVHMDDLPELLVVYDNDRVTNNSPSGSSRGPFIYKRAFPKPTINPTMSKNPRRGMLFLDSANTISEGRRSNVLRAPLFATLGPRGESCRRVFVAAKVANADCRSHHLLRREGKAYAAFPHEFFHDAKPVPTDAPFRAQRPAMVSRGAFPGWGVAMRPKSPAPAQTDPPIAPRFYGFYVPVDTRGKSIAPSHSSCKDFANSDCFVPEWPKSILLMEDCGEPINASRMAFAKREECCGLVERMHRQGFSHGAAHPRNILVQPGPLSVPQEERSMDAPSFRLVSYGRWCSLNHPLPKESPIGAKRAFEKGKEIDMLTAVMELRLGSSNSDREEDDEDDEYDIAGMLEL